METNEFTITLPSNSSMNYFPDNTTTNYSTKLAKEIELDSRWEVGISEIHIPCTTLHISREDAKLTPFFSFKHGIYSSIKDLLNSMNTDLIRVYKFSSDTILFEEQVGGFVSFQAFKKLEKLDMREVMPKMTDKLKRILGFNEVYVETREEPVNDPGNKPVSGNTSVKPKTIKKYIIHGKHPASLSSAIPDQLFVYCNLCEPCLVGDSHAPLLRIVNLSAKEFNFGSSLVKRFAPVNYIPLMHNRFQIVDIDIRDQFGKSIPFEFGTVTVSLHFRRQTLPY